MTLYQWVQIGNDLHICVWRSFVGWYVCGLVSGWVGGLVGWWVVDCLVRGFVSLLVILKQTHLLIALQ